MAVMHFNNDNFQAEVVNSKLPVLVDFWAQWCGPCKSIAPIIEDIAKEYEGRLKVGKVDVDESSQLASSFGIMSIPTLIVFKEGKVMAQIIGALSKQQLKGKIDQAI